MMTYPRLLHPPLFSYTVLQEYWSASAILLSDTKGNTELIIACGMKYYFQQGFSVVIWL